MAVNAATITRISAARIGFPFLDPGRVINLRTSESIREERHAVLSGGSADTVAIGLMPIPAFPMSNAGALRNEFRRR
jgi:hypothetical protein